MTIGNNKIEENKSELLINFIDPEPEMVKEEIAEEEKTEEEDIFDELNDPITNQASSRSSSKEIEQLRASMKSLDNVDKDVDLFSDKAKDREIKIDRTKDAVVKEGQGESERKTENAYTGRSTINYDLKNRYSDNLPNPIYTCMSGGKVQIDIVVNQQGRVIEASFNRRKSNTSNECLKEAALKYARRARFNSDFNASETQKGYITYQFQ